ncbi:hypothetical protein PCANC_07310 [Puccinia coronata f. sp. avenae]|uniref:Uncharacterized protein n=1 Tax=Puccinia coronata f. sp. avenae TaxID=200324 RepID=A0A2N5T6D5_9BASI|nr:hypothetical protein PCANC_07310 [Puccinia coronata f. sp. avenae]
MDSISHFSSSSQLPTSTSLSHLSLASSTISSSQAATPTATTAPVSQSGLPKSVGPEAPVFLQSDLPSRPASAAALPTPTPAPQVHNTFSLEVQPLVSTTVITIKTTSISSVSSHTASKQYISADNTTAYNTSTDSLPSAESSHHGPAGGLVIPQPIMYIIIAGIGLAVFLAGLTMWSCFQKRHRQRSRKLSFPMSPMSEKEWGTTREMAGGMQNVYRQSVITYDPKPHSKVLYEDLDFGPMVNAQLPTQEEMNQRKMDNIVSLIDIYGSTKGWDGSEFDNMLGSPNDYRPVTGGRTPCFVRNSPEHLSTLPRALLPGSYMGRQPTVPGFRPSRSSSGRLLAEPFTSVKMSPAEASKELQKIVERNFDCLSEHSESFDSDTLSGLNDTHILQSNPEHFPVLMGSFPAARKLSSSFLPGAANNQDRALLPLPRYNFKQS